MIKLIIVMIISVLLFLTFFKDTNTTHVINTSRITAKTIPEKIPPKSKDNINKTPASSEQSKQSKMIAGINAKKVEGPRSHQVNKIVESLCLPNKSDHCYVDLSKDIQKQIIELESGYAKSAEIRLILESDNFIEVIASLETSRTNDTGYIREQKYNSQINNLINDIPNISNNGITCGDTACIASFSYSNDENWQRFRSKFYTADLGNLFIREVESSIENNPEVRILFLPDNKHPVIQ